LASIDEMTRVEFDRLSREIYDLTGIVLPPAKQQLVTSRLHKRLNTLSLNSFGAYLDYLESENGPAEAEHLCNAITTNLTSFFREPHHFVDLRGFLDGSNANGKPLKRVRIWCAACSSGEEPYSAAMTAVQSNPSGKDRDIRILATDLDSDTLNKARSGTYPAESVGALPGPVKTRFFAQKSAGRFTINPEIRDMVTFNRLNLHDRWPMNGRFDAIFCRNVLIYFDAQAKRSLVSRMVALLQPGGALYLGHSESLLGHHPQLFSLGQTIFRKSQ